MSKQTKPDPMDSTGAMASAWFGTSAPKAVEAIFGKRRTDFLALSRANPNETGHCEQCDSHVECAMTHSCKRRNAR
jgi:hypothetical protein